MAFFLYDAQDTFISEMMSRMSSALPPDTSFEALDAENSQSVQNQQIVNAIENGTSLLIINAVDRLACSSIVEKCAATNTKVIFFNREPLEDAMGNQNIFYVGAAADILGTKQADMVAAHFGKSFHESEYDRNGDGIIQLAILKGEQGHQDAEKRTDNCVKRLKALGFSVEVLGIEVANWSREEAKSAMEQLYVRFGESIELVFSNNDDMALGAIDYLLQSKVFTHSASDKYAQPFVIAGVDGTAVGLEAIEKGLLFGTVQNDSISQANAILTLAERLLQNENLNEFPYEITKEHYIYIDGDIVTKDNVFDFVK